MDIPDCSWLGVTGDTLGPQHRLLSCSRTDFLFLALLSALWNPVPRRNVAVQRLLRKVGTRDSEASAMGHFRRTPGQGEIVRREDLRRLYLEAHARFLLLRRLRSLRGQLPGECGR